MGRQGKQRHIQKVGNSVELQTEVRDVFESLPVDQVTPFLVVLNSLIVLVRVLLVPAAVVYALVLLRRIARNTEQSK